MSNETYTKIPTQIFQADLSSLQFRFMCNFIRISGLNNGHSFFGYPKLAEINQCGRAAAIKTVKELEKMGFITVIDRGNKSRSNDILLTLDKVFSRPKSGSLEALEQGYLNNTPNAEQGYLKDTRGYLKDTREYLNNTPYIDKDLNNLNINNIYNEEYLNNTPNSKNISCEKNIAPVDVATGRTMPDIACADVDSLANKVCDEPLQADIEDFCLVSAFFENFAQLKPWINLSKIGGYYAIQPIGKLGERYLNEAKNSVACWFESRMVKMVFIPANQVLKGDKIEGVA